MGAFAWLSLLGLLHNMNPVPRKKIVELVPFLPDDPVHIAELRRQRIVSRNRGSNESELLTWFANSSAVGMLTL